MSKLADTRSRETTPAVADDFAAQDLGVSGNTRGSRLDTTQTVGKALDRLREIPGIGPQIHTAVSMRFGEIPADFATIAKEMRVTEATAEHLVSEGMKFLRSPSAYFKAMENN